jgi:hypothetical protein
MEECLVQFGDIGGGEDGEADEEEKDGDAQCARRNASR